MAGADNLKGHGFQNRTAEERRELAIIAGKKSGETRRRKANFKKTLNLLLSGELHIAELEPFLKSCGMESTAEAALCAALLANGIRTGDPKYFETIAKYAGIDSRTKEEKEEQKIRMEAMRKKMEEDDEDDAPEFEVVIEGEWCE